MPARVLSHLFTTTCLIPALHGIGKRTAMGKMTVSLGNPFLILLWSLAMLLLGCAIGLYWRATPGMAFCVAALGAVLMVIHDMAMGVLWFTVSAKLFAQARQDRS